MTTTQMSVDNAPRDLESLKKVGRFNLRILAQEAGAFATEESKSAFMAASSDDQAQTVCTLLQERDKASKGGAAGGQPVRQPSNKGSKKNAAAANGAAGPATTTTAGPAASAPAGDGALKMLAAIQELSAQNQGLREQVAELTSHVKQLQRISSGTNRFVTLAIGLNLKLAEQVLQASPEQVLGVVIEDLPVVENALMSFAPASDEDDGEDEEEEDEGNE